jgi:hypothetical protein
VYAKIDNLFLNLGFKHYEFNHSIYVLHDNGDTLIVIIYLDDLVITGNNLDLTLKFKRCLVDTFDMTYLGLLHYFLGLQVLPLSDGLFFSHSKYVVDIFKFFKMDNCKPCATPSHTSINLIKYCQTPKGDATLYRQLVGSLIYITHSRFDISFVVSVVSHFMQDPCKIH